jgi:hypothetical protein
MRGRALSIPWLCTSSIWCLTSEDRRYKGVGEVRGQEIILEEVLAELDVPEGVRSQVAHLVSHVSFTREMHDQKTVARVAEEYPALRIVHDADRLDGLATIDVVRLLISRGVGETSRHGSVDADIALIERSFSHDLPLMKTKTGRKLADKRYK